MPHELKVPKLGESITQVEIGRWLRQVGDPVERDEPLVELETDKATVELPSPAMGTLTVILKQKGQAASMDEVLAVIEESSQAGAAEPMPVRGAPLASSGEPGAAAPVDRSAPVTRPVRDERSKPQLSAAPTRPAAPRVMPAARRLLDEHGLAASEVVPSGPGGRLLKEDVLRHTASRGGPAAGGEVPAAAPGAEEPPRGPAAAPEAASSALPEAPPTTGPGEAAAPVPLEEVVPMSLLRRRIAERLVHAQHEAALLTTFNELDMSAVQAVRRTHQEAFRHRHGVKLGLMSFFAKATVAALKEMPRLNSELRGNDLITRRYVDLGIAVGGGRGLVVPVLRRADLMSFADLERAIADLAARAAENKLTLEELTGGTFTISNGGVYGSLLSTPIVNPPQSAILGLHAILDRPVVRDGAVVARPMMYVALTYDHRIVDGRESVTFLKRIKELVEEPMKLLLEI